MTLIRKSSLSSGLWGERQEEHDQPPTLYL